MDNLKIYLVSQAGFTTQTDLSATTAKLLLGPDFSTLKLFWDSFVRQNLQVVYWLHYRMAAAFNKSEEHCFYWRAKCGYIGHLGGLSGSKPEGRGERGSRSQEWFIPVPVSRFSMMA